MNSEQYWAMRSQQQLAANEREALATLKRMKSALDEAADNIDIEIAKIFGRYVDRNGLTSAEANAMLSKTEYKQWQRSIESYMAEIEALGLDSVKGQALWLEVETLSARSRITRLQSLRAAIDANMAKVATLQEIEISESLESIFKDDFYENMYEFYKQDAPEVLASMEAGTVALQNKEVLAIVMQPWSGANYSDRIWHNTYNLAFKVNSMVTQNMIAGKSPRHIARDMRNELQTSAKNVERLILTETAHIKTEADVKSYEESGYDRVKFSATFDERTCGKCHPMDGKVIAIDALVDAVNKPPLHPRCRCYLSPYDERMDELDRKYGTKIARDKNGKNVYIKPSMSYKEWHKKYIENA